MKSPKSINIPQAFIDLIDNQFLEAAKHLRTVLDDNPDLFASAAKQMKISIRKAYYLVEIDRNFRDSGISDRRLRRLGWTKLALIAPLVGKDKAQAKGLVDLAETLTAHKLKLFLRDLEIDPTARTVVLHFTGAQYALFEQAAILGGAIKDGKSLREKEAGLISFLTNHFDNGQAG